jgi:hypothetical protein
METSASFFWVEDGDSRFLLNVGTYLPNYIASHPRIHEQLTVSSVEKILLNTSSFLFHTNLA